MTRISEVAQLQIRNIQFLILSISQFLRLSISQFLRLSIFQFLSFQMFSFSILNQSLNNGWFSSRIKKKRITDCALSTLTTSSGLKYRSIPENIALSYLLLVKLVKWGYISCTIRLQLHSALRRESWTSEVIFEKGINCRHIVMQVNKTRKISDGDDTKTNSSNWNWQLTRRNICTASMCFFRPM